MAQTVAADDERGGTIDADLVRRAQEGDRAAFEMLVRPRLEPLLRLALSIVGNEADARDVVQDGCLSAWRELPRLRDVDRFEAWLWRIVINACRSSLRRRRRTALREIAVEHLPPGREPAHPDRALVDALSATDSIKRAFRRLDPDKRTILVLHHVEERSVIEIAHFLGIPEGTAKWRLHAARRALERALEVEGR